MRLVNKAHTQLSALMFCQDLHADTLIGRFINTSIRIVLIVIHDNSSIQHVPPLFYLPLSICECVRVCVILCPLNSLKIGNQSIIAL